MAKPLDSSRNSTTPITPLSRITENASDDQQTVLTLLRTHKDQWLSAEFIAEHTALELDAVRDHLAEIYSLTLRLIREHRGFTTYWKFV